MENNTNDKMTTIDAEYRVVEEEKDARQPLTPPAKRSGRAGVIAAIIIAAIAATAAITYYLTRERGAQEQGSVPQSSPVQGTGQSVQPRPPTPVSGFGTPFLGQKFDASGVTHVLGSDSVVFIDDDRPFEVLLMRIDGAGRQAGAVRPVSLGASIESPEGITFDGNFFYVVGSQSEPGKGPRNALARFTMDQNAQTATNLSVIPDFRAWLIARLPEIRSYAHLEGDDGGIKVEGITWDPANKRLLLGLRSPAINGQAVIIPLKLRDPSGAFTSDNLEIEGGRPIQVFLRESGIRDIQYDAKLNAFLIISAQNVKRGAFTLWEWDGASTQAKERAQLDSTMKPDGITQVKTGGQEFIFIVGDESRYLRLDY